MRRRYVFAVSGAWYTTSNLSIRKSFVLFDLTLIFFHPFAFRTMFVLFDTLAKLIILSTGGVRYIGGQLGIRLLSFLAPSHATDEER